jgi:hypothetical protein
MKKGVTLKKSYSTEIKLRLLEYLFIHLKNKPARHDQYLDITEALYSSLISLEFYVLWRRKWKVKSNF